MMVSYANNKTKAKTQMFALASRGEGGGSPLHRLRCHPEAASADRLPPKDLVLTELFLGQRGAGEVVCTAPQKLNIYEN
ncbi:MAG: hypothetical protein IJF21_08325, partial [Clostridia bacterium]|nr:hypothetical protein [Clostridia bacterium]